MPDTRESKFVGSLKISEHDEEDYGVDFEDEIHEYLPLLHKMKKKSTNK